MSELDRRAVLQGRSFSAQRDPIVDHPADDDEPPTDAPAAGEREGLPTGFRMRHDRHYVDVIASRNGTPPLRLIPVADIDSDGTHLRRDLRPLVESIAAAGIVHPLHVRRLNGKYRLITGARRLEAATAAGLTEVPCLVWEADDARAAAVAAADNVVAAPRHATDEHRPTAGLPLGAAREMADALSTIESCLSLLVGQDRPLRETVAVSLVKAEAHKARWMAEAFARLSADRPPAPKPMSPSGLVERCLIGFDDECRLAGVHIVRIYDDAARRVLADEHLAPLAVAGTVGTVLGLLRGEHGATLRVRVRMHPTQPLLNIECSQDHVPAPVSWPSAAEDRSFTAGTHDRGAALGLAIAHRVARLQSGHIEVSAGPRDGCTVTLALPVAE